MRRLGISGAIQQRHGSASAVRRPRVVGRRCTRAPSPLLPPQWPAPPAQHVPRRLGHRTAASSFAPSSSSNDPGGSSQCSGSVSASADAPAQQHHQQPPQALLWQVLSSRLSPHLSEPDFATRLWPRAAAPWSAAAAPPHGTRAAAELSAGLEALCTVLSPRQAAALLLAHPAAVAAPLAAWVEFLGAAAFSRSQQQQILLTAPELLVNANILTAGAALAHLRGLGFEEDAARHRVIAWAPQVLGMQPQEITSLISLWSKFQVGVDQREW